MQKEVTKKALFYFLPFFIVNYLIFFAVTSYGILYLIKLFIQPLSQITYQQYEKISANHPDAHCLPVPHKFYLPFRSL